MAFYALTVFFVTAVVTFLAIYTTPFVPVVTLGGTVLGAAVTGLAAALLGVLVRRVRPQPWIRAALILPGLTLVLTEVARFLPGWSLTPGVGTLVFLTALCLVLTALTEGSPRRRLPASLGEALTNRTKWGKIVPCAAGRKSAALRTRKAIDSNRYQSVQRMKSEDVHQTNCQ